MSSHIIFVPVLDILAKTSYVLVSSLSIANIVYILRKELTPQRTNQLIASLTLLLKTVDLKESDLKKAGEMYNSDYEDAIQICQASRIGASYIITRNISDYSNSKIPAITPESFLKQNSSLFIQ